MISRLRIEGLAIIDSLDIDFSSGLNIITGETGAGKSILIRAIHFLFGAKFGVDAIRQGYEQASVSAIFDLPSTHAAVIDLKNRGLISSESKTQTVVIRRVLNQKGKHQGWVNDTPVTISALREMSGHLIDIFAQHENQRLLNKEKHVFYLDLFLRDSKVLEAYKQQYTEADKKLTELLELLEKQNRQERDSDYWEFRLEELKKFNPSKEEYAQIREYCLLAEKSQTLRESLSNARNCLEGDAEGSGGAVLLLQELSRVLSRMRVDDIGDVMGQAFTALKSRAEALSSEVSDVASDLEKIASLIEVDEDLLEQRQQRLFGYQSLLRKMGVTDIEGLIYEQESIETRVLSKEKQQEKIQSLVQDFSNSVQVLWGRAEVLSSARATAANIIQSSVQEELKALVMAGAVFESEFTPVAKTLAGFSSVLLSEKDHACLNKALTVFSKCSSSGAEHVQFLMSTNPGEPILPLAQIASGGEVSRVMLAVKKALIADAETCVLVFDEIDTGISGRVADVVGRKMRELSENVQVICISHLAQVAVYADAHFLVQKKEVKKKGSPERTSSTILRLSAEESSEEIARLLSGDEVSKDSLANAKNLMARAKGKEKTKKKTVSARV